MTKHFENFTTARKSNSVPAEAYPETYVTEEDPATSPTHVQFENVDSAYITLPAIEGRAVGPFTSEEMRPQVTDPIPEKIVRKNVDIEGDIHQNYDIAARTIGGVMESAGGSHEFFGRKALTESEAEATRHEQGKERIKKIVEAAMNEVRIQADRMYREEEAIHSTRVENGKALESTNNKTRRENLKAFGNLQRIIGDGESTVEALAADREEAIRKDAELCAELGVKKGELEDAKAELARLTDELLKFRGERTTLLSTESDLYSQQRAETNRLEQEVEAELRAAMGVEPSDDLETAEKELIDQQREIAKVKSTALITIKGDILQIEQDKRYNQRDIDSYETLVADKKEQIGVLTQRLNNLPGLISKEKAKFVKASDAIESTELGVSDRVALGAEQFRIINEGKATDRKTVIIGNEEVPIHAILMPLYNSIRALQNVLLKNTDAVKESDEARPTFDTEALRSILRRDESDVIDFPDLDRVLNEKHQGSKERAEGGKTMRGRWDAVLTAIGLKRPVATYDLTPSQPAALELTEGQEE